MNRKYVAYRNAAKEDRAKVICSKGNMYKNFGEDRTCSSRDMLADKQTHRPTHKDGRSSQYFATVAAVK